MVPADTEGVTQMKQYQQVTDRIIAMLEAGTRPWAQDWSAPGGGRPLRHDGTPYRGANVLNLWAAAMARGMSGQTWMTYKKAQELGGQVKKGAKSEAAFYVGAMVKTVEVNGQDEEARIPFMKAYLVFNTDEIADLPAQYYGKAPVLLLDPSARIEAADSWVSNTGAVVHHGGGRAFYRHAPADFVQMPEFETFNSASGYYGTLFHELTHWSGAEKRLDRTKGKIFGDPAYSFEEMVAELGAAFVCADLRISAEPREDHASYIGGWLKKLREDNRAIFKAASLAEKAAGYLHGLQPGAAAEVEEPAEALAA
jgi:antirestriction protein ArdC